MHLLHKIHSRRPFPARMRLTFCTCAVDSFCQQHFSDISVQFFNISDQMGRKNDQTEKKLYSEYDYECIMNSLSTYSLLSRKAGVSNQNNMASSQSKQCTCILISSADQCGFSACEHPPFFFLK